MYTCTTNVCYVYALSTQTLQRENVHMYVCVCVITYVYDFTESNATTR